MGKAEEEQAISSALPSSPEGAEGNVERRCPQCRWIGPAVRPRCVAALLLGAVVLLSAIFWLPPFLRRQPDSDDPDLLGVDIVASFRLQKPVNQLNANIGKLQYDIFEEIAVPNSSVAVLYLEPIARSKWTNVVFGVRPYPRNTTISATGLSILRASFMTLVTQQSVLHLTTSLFGNSSFFQVWRFPGGITIIPPQTAFLLQEVYMLFNFTLNFPISEVQDKISELKDQMKLGLLLNSYENLYVTLTNMKGSTVAPPTIVQTSVVLAIGNRQPSLPRLKQLAQTIKNSSAGNLGLNHTVFGRVKQIRLSSFLQHSLTSGSSSWSPSPAPQPDSYHHHHHHHRHHHSHHHSNIRLGPAPAPQHSYQAPVPSPPRCHFGSSIKPRIKAHLSPATAPGSSSHHSSTPHRHEDPPAPSPAPSLHPRLVSPLPAVTLAHVRPPSESVTDIKPPDGMPSISPLPSSWVFFLENLNGVIVGMVGYVSNTISLVRLKKLYSTRYSTFLG